MNYDMKKIFNLKKDCNICPNIIVGDNYRISIIKENIIRFEYSSEGTFNDKMTQKILTRHFGEVDYKVVKDDQELIVDTGVVTLYYDKKEPTMEGLQIKLNRLPSQDSTWKYGKGDYQNLLGTARTLDGANGEVELEQGLISKGGFAFFDDSKSQIIEDTGIITEKLISDDYVDVYYMYHSDDIAKGINDWYSLSGYPAKISRQYLGNWWSRYWEYNEDSLKEVIVNFKKRNIPLAVNIMDMDWHTVPTMEYGYGWTGFSWNKELFPNPEAILRWQHDENLLVSLNLHPADGFREHEDIFKQMQAKLDTEGKIINFDLTDYKFLEAYFKLYIKEQQELGVDFWWLDWQQGDETKIKGLDPLYVLNHLHYLDSCDTVDKPLIFSRYGGLGSHRYPIGFSGDTYMTWDSLKFQPYFTATSANVGYNYWSHDIGGHFHGKVDNELYVRWLQFGVYSPIMRLHSSKNIMIYKEPWNFPVEIETIATKYLQHRHKLISYINTYNSYTSNNGLQLIRPIYHEDFNSWDAYTFKNEYFFGNEMIVHPITDPINKEIGGNIITTYLPKGIWYDNKGVSYKGEDTYKTFHKLEDTPIFYRAGSIIMYDHDITTSALKEDSFDLQLFVGKGEYKHYHEQSGLYSTMTQEIKGNKILLTIKPSEPICIESIKVIGYETLSIDRKISKAIEDETLITIKIMKKANKINLFELIKYFDLDSDIANGVYHKLKSKSGVDAINSILNSELSNEQKEVLYSKYINERE